MIPSHGEVGLQLVFLLIVIVHAKHLVRLQAVASTAAATTARGETSVAGIVQIAKHHNAAVILHISCHDALCITALRTYGQVDICKKTFVHSPLDIEVEDCLLFTVIHTGHLCQVTLFIVSLYFVYYGRRKILECCLRVAGHKLLTIYHNLLHFLTVDGYLSIIINLCSRQTLHQLLYHRAFGSVICRCVIDKSIFLHYNLSCHAIGHHLFQQNGIGLHAQPSKSEILAFADGEITCDGLIADVSDFDDVASRLLYIHGEIAIYI